MAQSQLTVPDKASESFLRKYFAAFITADSAKWRDYSEQRHQHSHLTRTYQKIDKILRTDTALSETQVATLTSSLEQLTQKREMLRQLDAEIAQAIQKEDELEAEILEVEETQVDKF